MTAARCVDTVFRTAGFLHLFNAHIHGLHPLSVRGGSVWFVQLLFFVCIHCCSLVFE